MMSNTYYVHNRKLLYKPVNILFFLSMLGASVMFNEKGYYPLAYSMIVSLFFEVGRILFAANEPVKIKYIQVGLLIPFLGALIAVVVKVILLRFF